MLLIDVVQWRKKRRRRDVLWRIRVPFLLLLLLFPCSGEMNLFPFPSRFVLLVCSARATYQYDDKRLNFDLFYFKDDANVSGLQLDGCVCLSLPSDELIRSCVCVCYCLL